MSKEFNIIKDVITEVRDLRTRLRLRESTLYHKGSPFINENADLIIKLSGIAAIDEVRSGYGLHLTTPGVDGWLDVEHSVINEYLEGMQKQQSHLMQQAKILDVRLANKQYTKHAPKKLVLESKHQLADINERLKSLESQINNAKSSLK
jgi:valyl-tRNA synthetase